MQLKEKYDQWCCKETETYIAREFDEESVTKRLKAVSSQLRRDVRIAEALDRMAPTVRKAELMRQLRKEVMLELALPSLADWALNNQQGDLF